MSQPSIDTLVFTRCVFFRSDDTTRLERQINYFLGHAPLAALHRMETNALGQEVLVTLWFDLMPAAENIDAIYSAAVRL
ncbi:MAG: hypothetical protein RBU37_19520 [Myxococcota bacterium]|jgi:hypothetical protein|nr:hypothetical protein [Myxococcota bacterium]